MASVDRLDEIVTLGRNGDGTSTTTHANHDRTAVALPERVTVIARVSLMSVAKLALAFWSAVGVFILCASAVVYTVLNALGIVGNVERFAADLTSNKHFHLVSVQLFLFVLFVTLMFVAIATALTLVGAAFYNLLAHMCGGIRIATRERVAETARDRELSPGRLQA